MRRKASLILAASACSLLLVGCPHDEYEVVMRPQGQKLHRKVVVRHVEDKGEPKLLRKSENIHAASLPDDLDGNRGYYWHYETELGSASAYSERVRGNDDQAGTLEKQNAAIDRLARLVAGWARQQFGRHKQIDKLVNFIETDARKDVKNIVLLAFMADVVRRIPTTSPATQPEVEVMSRGLQYLVERNYFDQESVSKVVRSVGAGEAGKLAPVIDQFLRRKVGLTDAVMIEDVRQMLLDIEKLRDSFVQYVEGTADFKIAVQEWQRRDKDRRGEAKAEDDPEPTAFYWAIRPALASVENLLEAGTPDDFSITLHIDGPPIVTNGQVNMENGTIAWKFTYPKSDRPVPALLYAVWATPDEAAQKQHFGRVAIDGGDLVSYAVWRKALSADEAKAWSDLVARIKPDTDIDKLLADFSLPGQSVEETAKEVGVKLLKEAMKKE